MKKHSGRTELLQYFRCYLKFLVFEIFRLGSLLYGESVSVEIISVTFTLKSLNKSLPVISLGHQIEQVRIRLR